MRLPIFRSGEFELDPAARELRRNGERVPLAPKSFDCLSYLIAHRERAVGRDELIAAVWGRVEISDTVVAQTMLRARKALGDAGDAAHGFVRTVPRFGYHWVAPVEEVARHHAVPEPPVLAGVPEGTVAPAPPAHRERPHALRWGVALGVIAALAIAGVVAWRLRPSPTSPHRPTAVLADSVLVLPVRVDSPESEDTWVRLGAMDYLASRLRQGGMRVVPSEQALHLNAQADGTRPIDAPRAQELQRVGEVRWVVAPQAEREPRGWRVRLAVFHEGREQMIEARGASALVAAAGAADSWLRRVHPDRARSDIGPSELDQRLQQIDAELLAGQLTAARRLIEAVTPRERIDPALLVREGQIEFRTGRIDEAARLFERTLAHTPLAPEVRAKALMGQGAIDIRRGEPARAQAHYAQALQVFDDVERIDDPALPGNAYNGLGVALVQQGHMDEAVRNMGLARVSMQRSGNLVEAATVGTNLGMIEQQRRHYPQALQEFDGAIAVFERFDVRDYMAVALSSRATAQMDMVQPDAAMASIDRARALAASITDRLLMAHITVVHAQVQLARGRLDDVARDIDALHALQLTDADAAMCELRVRLHLARGERRVAIRPLDDCTGPETRAVGRLTLAAVQAALHEGDIDTASKWVARREAIPPAQRSLEWDIAGALLAQAKGDDAQAQRVTDAALVRVEQAGSPLERVQAGLLKARLLRMRGRAQHAVPVIVDLDAFASTDYRVAWESLALYRALGDPVMSKQALARVQSLRGERDIAMEPAL